MSEPAAISRSASRKISRSVSRDDFFAPGLRIGVIGFGNFGQFLAGRLARQHAVFVTNFHEDVAPRAEELGCTWVPWEEAGFEMLSAFRVDVLLIATSIVSFEEVVSGLPAALLREVRPLMVDVLSVKEFPKEVFLKHLPEEVDILCTHPMFGPQTARGGWEGLRFVFERVRTSDAERARRFLDFFEGSGCIMVEMSCETHDKQAAKTQFLTHLTGRVLGELPCGETPIDTVSYKDLCKLRNTMCNNSFDLFYGLLKYNKHSVHQLQQLKDAVQQVEEALMMRAAAEMGA